MKLIVLWLAGLVMAFAEAGYTKSYNSCMDNSGGVTSNMLGCISQEIKHHDTLLNLNYKQVMSLLGQEKKQELKSAQRAWIKYRDANCGFYDGLTGGTMDRLMASECVLSMTANRAAELKSIYETM